MAILDSTTRLIFSPRPDRREWGVILAIALLGLMLRAMFPGRLAVEHFDEGVYASNLWFDADERFRYPARHLYAPPLLPWLLEWSQIIFGPTPLGTMLIGILTGTLTIVLIWWVVRTWFGPSAGIAAGALAAMSDYHGLFSRTALTEPVLCLLLLLGVYFVWVTLVKLEIRSALLAGFTTGLAWCTKYNGWLPLAIGGSCLSAWAVRPMGHSLNRGRRFLLLGVIGAIALLVFSPVLWDLGEDGGYRAVQQNHARYLVGISGWFDSLVRQVANHRHIDGPLSWIGIMLAILCSCLLAPRDPQTTETSGIRKWLWAISWSTLLAALAMGLGTSVVLALLSLVWFIAACPWWRQQAKEYSIARDLAYWLTAAWFWGLLLSTPLYTPYPRLSLPWLLAAWIAFAAMIGPTFAQKLALGQAAWQLSRMGTACLVLMSVASISAFAGKMVLDPPRLPLMWKDRTGLESIAWEIRQEVRTRFGDKALVYVYAEPSLYFHLRASGLELVAPVADLGFMDRSAPVPVLLVQGPHAERSDSFQAEFQKDLNRWEHLGEFSYRPSPLVLLDQYAPTETQGPEFERKQTVRLYLLNPR